MNTQAKHERIFEIMNPGLVGYDSFQEMKTVYDEVLETTSDAVSELERMFDVEITPELISLLDNVKGHRHIKIVDKLLKMEPQYKIMKETRTELIDQPYRVALQYHIWVRGHHNTALRNLCKLKKHLSGGNDSVEYEFESNLRDHDKDTYQWLLLKFYEFIAIIEKDAEENPGITKKQLANRWFLGPYSILALFILVRSKQIKCFAPKPLIQLENDLGKALQSGDYGKKNTSTIRAAYGDRIAVMRYLAPADLNWYTNEVLGKTYFTESEVESYERVALCDIDYDELNKRNRGMKPVDRSHSKKKQTAERQGPVTNVVVSKSDLSNDGVVRLYLHDGKTITQVTISHDEINKLTETVPSSRPFLSGQDVHVLTDDVYCDLSKDAKMWVDRIEKEFKN